MILAAAVFAVIAKDQLGGDLVGLSLSYALSITTSLNTFVRMSAETENSFNAVERIEEYTRIEQEAEWQNDKRPPKNWPSTGAISIKDLELKYRADRNSVMKDLSIDFKPSEKIGIVGRTGAGKSTLFQALFRIMEPFKGSIEFDGQDITQFGLHDIRYVQVPSLLGGTWVCLTLGFLYASLVLCRRAIAIIPQDPVLFAGTVRSNLDPLDEHKSPAIWEVRMLNRFDMPPLTYYW